MGNICNFLKLEQNAQMSAPPWLWHRKMKLTSCTASINKLQKGLKIPLIMERDMNIL